MALEDVRQLARGILLDLAECVWSEKDVESLSERADALKAQVRRGYDDLMRRRRGIEHLQHRVEVAERKVTALPWQVETYLQTGNRNRAWRAALELDDVRCNLAHDRARLRQLEADYRRHVVSLERDRRQLGDLQRQLIRLHQAHPQPSPGVSSC